MSTLTQSPGTLANTSTELVDLTGVDANAVDSRDVDLTVVDVVDDVRVDGAAGVSDLGLANPVGLAGPAGSAGLVNSSRRPKGRNRHGRGLARILAEWLAIIAVALSVALLVRATVIQAFWIPSTSMTPTLQVNDRLLVDKVSFQVREIGRGEIIVFERPAKLQEDFKDLIKRVVGLPGDTVEGRDGAVFVNGKKLAEPYLPAGVITKDFPPQQVPIDNYFVMGDNREVSWDSRYWGTVERKLVVGKAILRVWPPSQAGRL